MKKIRKILLTTILLSLSIVISGCGRKKINLNDYIEISLSGNYNGQATASANINYDSIIAFMHEGEEIDDFSLISEYIALENAFKVTLDKVSLLNNGDIIH